MTEPTEEEVALLTKVIGGGYEVVSDTEMARLRAIEAAGRAFIEKVPGEYEVQEAEGLLADALGYEWVENPYPDRDRYIEKESPVRDMYARMAAQYVAETPLSPDGGGVVGDRYPFEGGEPNA